MFFLLNIYLSIYIYRQTELYSVNDSSINFYLLSLLYDAFKETKEYIYVKNSYKYSILAFLRNHLTFFGSCVSPDSWQFHIKCGLSLRFNCLIASSRIS